MWIEDRFVLLVTLNEPSAPSEVPVEVWHVMAMEGDWQLQKYALPDTPFFSAPRAASGEIQVQPNNHGVFGSVLLQDREPPCEFESGSPFAAGGIWEERRFFLFLEETYQLWESQLTYYVTAPGGERVENWMDYCVEETNATSEVVATDPAVMVPVTPTRTVNQPSEGDEIAIAQPFMISGRLTPPPDEETTVTVRIAIDGGTHPNFDFVTVDTALLVLV